MTTRLEDLASNDVYDPAIIECPMHYDTALREHAPVFHDDKNDMYIVSKYELIKKIILDHETYSNRYIEKLFSKEPLPDEIAAIYAQGYVPEEVLVVSDGEVHERHRAIATRAFSRKRLKELAPLLAKEASRLIDKVIDKGQMEFLTDIAEPLPLNILQQQLRVPDEEMPLCREWSRILEGGFGGTEKSLDTMRYEAEQTVACQKHFAARIEVEMEKIKSTGQGFRDDDVITQLAQAILDPDDPMDMNEAISYIVNLFPATNGTTTLVFLACMHQFTQNPEIQAKIAENPKYIAKLIEETMRHESPLRNFWRRTTRKSTIGGVEIPEGQWILLRICSAHKDEETYDNPEEFDIDRKSSSAHFGFGSGIHMCAGRFFARYIVTEVLTQLSQRASNFEFVEGQEIKRRTHFVAPAFEALHIKFTPN